MNYKLNKNLMMQKKGDKVTIFSGKESVLYTLNETASYIFEGLKLGWTREKIIKGLTEEYGASLKEAEEDLYSMIEKFEEEKILS